MTGTASALIEISWNKPVSSNNVITKPIIVSTPITIGHIKICIKVLVGILYVFTVRLAWRVCPIQLDALLDFGLIMCTFFPPQHQASP